MKTKRVKVELTLEVEAIATPAKWDWRGLLDLGVNEHVLGVRVEACEEAEAQNELAPVPIHAHAVWLCSLLQEAGFAPAKWLPAGPRLAQAASGKLVEMRLNDPRTSDHYTEIVVDVTEPTTLATVRRSFPFPWRFADGRIAVIIGYTLRPEKTNLFHVDGRRPTRVELAAYFCEIDAWLSSFGVHLS